jgi:hypothetical protein
MWTGPHCLLICTATCQVPLGKGLLLARRVGIGCLLPRQLSGAERT